VARELLEVSLERLTAGRPPVMTIKPMRFGIAGFAQYRISTSKNDAGEAAFRLRTDRSLYFAGLNFCKALGGVHTAPFIFAIF
jgi:hypothetical protein